MKHIYEGAQEVIAWLGPMSQDSESALDFIHFLQGVYTARLLHEDLRPALRTALLLDQYRTRWVTFLNLFLRR